MRHAFRRTLLAGLSIWCALALTATFAATVRINHVLRNTDVIDLSVPVAANLPAHWAGGLPLFQLIPYVQIGPDSVAATDVVLIDEHTGTQWDAPAHFVPPPDSGLPNAGPNGKLTADLVETWKFAGEACVIDATGLLDKAAPGVSPIITVDMIKTWEAKYRPLGPGDAVLFRSGFTDKYYQPMPAGRRLVADVLDKKTPGWPDPDPACMSYITGKGVYLLGTDAPSMGPVPDLAADTHIAGAKNGAIWAEMLMNLDKLPPTGSVFMILSPKHAGGSGGECRAIAVTNKPLADKLMRGIKAKRVIDLSVLLREDLPITWPGAGVGHHAMPYVGKTLHWFTEPGGPYFARWHMMDMHAGTHLDPPAHFLPPPGFNDNAYGELGKSALADYEKLHGKRGNSNTTTELVPVQQMVGPARVIDAQQLVGTTDMKTWPASPMIEVKDIQAHETAYGPLEQGEIVLFRSGHTDRTFRPAPEGSACVADPLNGKAEGWPSPSVECIRYLARKGIRCLGTDGPSMGSTDPKLAAHTHWAAAGEGIVFVEFLTGLGQLPNKGTVFIFQPVKIVGGHGGPGRALAVLP